MPRQSDMEWMEQEIAKQAAEDAAVQVTEMEVIKEAIHLLGWAKKKPIRYTGMGKLYSSGKWSMMMVPNMVKGLLAAGYVVGNERMFMVNTDACKELRKKYPPGSLDDVNGFN